MFGNDPGPCGICGAAHTSCTASGTALITAPQLPARDALGRAALAVVTPPLVAEVVQPTLPVGEFTSATYRGDKGRRR